MGVIDKTTLKKIPRLKISIYKYKNKNTYFCRFYVGKVHYKSGYKEISLKTKNINEAISKANTEFTHDIKELHSRVTSNYKELTEMITLQHKEQALHIQQLQNDLNGRVGILEKWRWLIIGGAIVVGFALQKMPIWG